MWVRLNSLVHAAAAGGDDDDDGEPPTITQASYFDVPHIFI